LIVESYFYTSFWILSHTITPLHSFFATTVYANQHERGVDADGDWHNVMGHPASFDTMTMGRNAASV